MRKKSLAIALALLMCFSVVGCNGQDASLEESPSGEEVSEVETDVTEEGEDAGLPEQVMVERLSEEATTNTISAELKEKALEMPYADYQTLPDWYGTTLVNKAAYASYWGAPHEYTKELVDELSEVGFNFIRVVVDTRIFYLESQYGEPGEHFDGTSDYVNTEELRNLDDLISWCIDAGIHVCIDVHNTPGGYMLGGDEEASRELLFTEGSPEEQMFIDYWEFMAMRYADVPNNALSFNLYNEPPFWVEDEQYTKLMKKTIDAVQKTSPDRLIFVDMLHYAKDPCYGLVGEKVVQTFHLYEPYEFTHNLVDDSESAKTAAIREMVTYPLPAISAAVRDDGYIVSGDFPAGTVLTMRIDEAKVGTELVLSADGKKVFSQVMDQELVDEHGLVPDEYNDFCVYNEENPDAISITHTYRLEEDATELRFDKKGNDEWGWIDLNSLKIKTDTYATKLDAVWVDGVEIPSTRATVDENGFVTVDDKAAVYNYGKETLKEKFQEYKDFSEETGTLIMLQEFGNCVYCELNGSVNLFDDMLSLCDEFDIPWCQYNYDGAEFSIVAASEEYRRRGATYEKLSSGREICVEIRDVLQKYMK
jgi:hypothetical protein